MKFKFLKALIGKGVIKCTLNKDGRMGFSSSAVKKLSLPQFKFAKIALDEDKKRSTDLYLFLTNEEDGDTMKIYSAVGYYNLRTKRIFDDLKFDYRNKKYIFDIREMEFEGKNIYKLEKRVLQRKKGSRIMKKTKS